MDRLKILDLYNNSSDKTKEKFASKVDSTLEVKLDYDKVDCDYEWLDIMEDTIRYLDNILRNPNRFIVNEEEVIKIELARRVTVESIKHLSRNTNLIQDYDKETGDVKPSKILNINKEESFNTYENRFIYSLIQNMKSFIARKKSMNQTTDSSTLKDNKLLNYSAKTKVGEEEVNISMQLDSKINNNNPIKDESGLSINDRIEKLELQIADLTNSDVYKNLAKLHVALVTSPIKKTNVILKNVNFQYAVKLWNYMQENIDGKNKRIQDNRTYKDTGELKNYIDESFLLNYLAMDTLNKKTTTEEEKKEIKEEASQRIVSTMLDQMLTIDENLTEDELKNIVIKQYEVIKYKNITNIKSLYNIFNKQIDKYLNKFNNLKI
ncbi:MAG: DUF2357 domain-containing protein [Bacilli bacterium]|nr:DUF2357 domain-containing protein [Bacilli bacterium]